MKISCIFNDPHRVADHQFGRATKFSGPYPITPGNEYLLVGMSIVENVFEFLIGDDSGRPCFAPAGMFNLMSMEIPKEWHFALKSGIHASGRQLWTHPVVAVWGFKELLDEQYVEALLTGDQEAFTLFKHQLDIAADDGEPDGSVKSE